MNDEKESKREELSRELQNRLMTDGTLKEDSALVLTGLICTHYALGRLKSRSDVADEEVESIFKAMRDISMQPYPMTKLHELLKDLESALVLDMEATRSRQQKLADLEKERGIGTPFEMFNGALKPGKVLLLSGPADVYDVFVTYLRRHWSKTAVPFTHFRDADDGDMVKDAPGVLEVPRSWWGQGLKDGFSDTAKGVFEVCEAPVVIIDTLEKLGPAGNWKEAKKLLKALTKICKRFQISAVVRYEAARSETTPSNVRKVEVCRSKLNGKEVLYAGEQMYEEAEDGPRRVGSGTNEGTELGGDTGGPEGAGELQGPGED